MASKSCYRQDFHRDSRRIPTGGVVAALRAWIDGRRRERAERLALLARLDSLAARVDALVSDVRVLQAKAFGSERRSGGGLPRGGSVAGN